MVNIIKSILIGILCSAPTMYAHSESSTGSTSASARVNISVNVPEVTVLLKQVVGPETTTYTVWTNARYVYINNQRVQILSVGENTFSLPTPNLFTLTNL